MTKCVHGNVCRAWMRKTGSIAPLTVKCPNKCPFYEPDFDTRAHIRKPELTCRNFGGEEGTNGEYYDFACSACGFCCDQPEPNYCPNCGARVVTDDANE